MLQRLARLVRNGPSSSCLSSNSAALQHAWTPAACYSRSAVSSNAAAEATSASSSSESAAPLEGSGLSLGGADMVVLPPLVATHPIRRTVDVAPPGVNAALHRKMNMPFAGEQAGKKGAAEGKSSETASASEASSAAAASESDELMLGGGGVSDLLSRRAGDKRYGSRRRVPGELPVINEGALPELTEDRPPMSERLFAVVSVGGSQYKLTPGDILTAEHIPGAEVGSILELEDVLAVGSQAKTVLGRPVVPGATVRVAVEEQCQDAKVIVFKKNRRKRYQKTQGHRRLVTRLRVLGVDFAGKGGLDAY